MVRLQFVSTEGEQILYEYVMLVVENFPSGTLTYYFDDQPLTPIEFDKGLGVTFDSKLRFNPLYVNVLSSASRMSGFVLCSCH